MSQQVMSWDDRDDLSDLEQEARRLCGAYKTAVGSDGWQVPPTDEGKRAVEEAWVRLATYCRGTILFLDDAAEKLHAAYARRLDSWAIVPLWRHLGSGEKRAWGAVIEEAHKIHNERQA
jgi:hypothetical protein